MHIIKWTRHRITWLVYWTPTVCICPESMFPSFTNKSLIFLWGTIPPLPRCNWLHLPRQQQGTGCMCFSCQARTFYSFWSKWLCQELAHDSSQASVNSGTWDRSAPSPRAAKFTECKFAQGACLTINPTRRKAKRDKGEIRPWRRCSRHGWNQATEFLSHTSQYILLYSLHPFEVGFFPLPLKEFC